MTADEAAMMANDDAHRAWKRSAAPMYDWLTNHHLVWPALACRFGAKVDGSGDVGKYEQVIYYSEQVDKDDKTHNKLIKQVANVHEENYTPIDHINNWKENQKSPYFSKTDKKVINHIGECNKIRVVHQKDDTVVTHSDCAEVFLWNMAEQPAASGATQKGRGKGARNIPNLKLTGHNAVAPFALDTSTASPAVVSGGEDNNVCLWQLQDEGQGGADAAGGARSQPPSLAARTTFTGHQKVVSDVCFQPGTDHMLLSSSDDHIVKMWDAREGKCVKDIQQAHSEDVMAIDWAAHGHAFATGDAHGRVTVYDIRALSDSAAEGTRSAKTLHDFEPLGKGGKAMLSVCWNPLRPSWLSCGGDDGRVSVYDISRPSYETPDKLPAQLVLQHVGHLGNIMDAQWSPHDPFVMMSVSNDGHTYKEGGACQLWRLSWLLTAPLEEAEAQLSGYQQWLESGKLADLQNVIHVEVAPPQDADKPDDKDEDKDLSPAAMHEPPEEQTASDAAAAGIAAMSTDAAPAAAPPAGAQGEVAGDVEMKEDA